MIKNYISSTGLVLAVVLLLAINILSNLLFKSARIDLTENKLYTLSSGSENILRGLQDTITIHLYISEKIAANVPGLTNYANRVRDLLEEFRAVSNGNVKLIVTDPEPFSDEEDQAVQYGLRGVSVDKAGSPLYFGLVGISATDDEKVIPFLQPDKEESLEFDIIKLIYDLSDPEKKTVGIMSTLPIEGNAASRSMMPNAQSREWMIVTTLKKSFNVKSIDINTDKIPADIDILMLVHPKNMSGTSLFAIDQFVLNGGRAIIFVDPHAEMDLAQHDPQDLMAAANAIRYSNLRTLFDNWGIELAEGQVVGDINMPTRVTVNMGRTPRSIDYVAWLSLKQANFNKSDFVTANLNQINMATAGQLKIIQNTEFEITPLIETTTGATLFPQSNFQFSPSPAALLNQYKKGGEKLMLAARISGKAQTAFPDGPPASAAKEENEEGDNSDNDNNNENKDENENTLTVSKENINVIVVADTDILADRFWVEMRNVSGRRSAVPRANNGVFVVNAIDNLSGSNDLISLRSRGKFSRPFSKVEEIRRDAEQKFREKEKALQTKLKEAENKLRELQQHNKDGNNTLILSPAQQKEITEFRKEQAKTRKELRNVQHELKKDIESLGSLLKFINIGLIPILIILFATIYGVYKQRSSKATT